MSARIKYPSHLSLLFLFPFSKSIITDCFFLFQSTGWDDFGWLLNVKTPLQLMCQPLWGIRPRLCLVYFSSFNPDFNLHFGRVSTELLNFFWTRPSSFFACPFHSLALNVIPIMIPRSEYRGPLFRIWMQFWPACTLSCNYHIFYTFVSSG